MSSLSADEGHRGVLGSLARAAIASAAALGAVVTGIVAANLVQHATGSTTGGQGPVVAAGPETTTAAPGPRSSSPAPTASLRPSTLPTPGPASTVAPRTSAPVPSTTSAQPSAAAPVDTRPTVTVLNVSRVKGLAARAADQMQAKGWTVAGTGDAVSSIASTTCYYDAGMQGACAQLMKDVPGVKAMAPRPDAIKPRGGIVVLVTKTYA